MIGRTARRVVARPSGAGLAVAVISALVQLGPVIGRGYVLVRDMVFVPRPPLTDHLLGADTVPRAVPSDLLVALLSHVVPGDVVQDVVLLAILVMAGWGAARIVPSRSAVAGAAASLLYSWNPYVDEHLRQGQWAVLVGYAALPWAVSGALGLREGRQGSGWLLAVAVAAGAAGGASPELLVALGILPVLLWPGGEIWRHRCAIGVLALAVFALPWLVPSLTQPSSPPADHVGVALFAARPETSLGTAASLLGLGGLWNAQVIPPGRGTVIVVAVSALLSIASLAALWATRRRWRPRAFGGVMAAGVVSFVVAGWGATPGIRVVLEHLVVGVSGAGLLRDGQRQLAPFALVIAVGFGLAVELAVRYLTVARLLVLAPALLLPAAAWGSDGALSATSWPADWPTAQHAVAALPPGPILVLPWASGRAYSWNDRTASADPAALWLGRRVVADDALDVGGTSTPLEDPAARRIAAAATGRAPLVPALRQQGYAGVLLERDQPGAAASARGLSGAPVRSSTGTIAVYSVPGTPVRSLPHGPVDQTLAADAFAAVAALLAVAAAGRRTRFGDLPDVHN